VDEKGFRAFVAEGRRVKKDLSEEEIRSNLKMIDEFERFLSRKSPPRSLRVATAMDLEEFVGELSGKCENTEENLLGLLRYARFENNKAVEAAAVQMLDGATVMVALSEIVKDRVGAIEHRDIFDGIEFPAIGSPMKDWPKVTKVVMERLESGLGKDGCREALLAGPHTAPDEHYLPEKKKFEESEDIDAFLMSRSDDFVALLKQCMDENTLFFNQEIDEDVLNHVRGNREMGGGVRNGDIIYETKIPYMAREYLREVDRKMKRYYYCHCPWVREAILSGLEVPSDFCYCSAAYHKKPWDVIFGEPVEVEVVSSVLRGDLVCRYAIKIPEKHHTRREPRS
jgi:hypothetical protein